MRQYYYWSLVGLLFLFLNGAQSRIIVKRQINFDSSIDPAVQEISYESADDRDKRAVGNSGSDPKFAIKNALLGFVFNKINSFIDQKTAWISQLDKTNIAKNAAAGIQPPQDSVASISGAISGVIGQKLQAASPLISIITSKLTSGSLGGSSSGGGGFNLGSLLGGGGASAQVQADPSKGSSSFASRTTSSTTKRPTTTEDIVIFEKNKPASLELPSELFGSSFTLVTRASTAISDYMINSAIRLQRLLEVFRPAIRAVFGKKGFVSEVSTDKPIFSDSSSSSE
ncbi:hypothetical protein FQR65_LT02871 [Abscondita terminalis]|nr:hypothetical protein FQR65_LT02871 [Abscondita terminalis]